MVRGGYRFSLWVNHLASTVFSQEVVTSSSANVLDDIFSGAETHFLSTVHDADAYVGHGSCLPSEGVVLD